MVIARHRLDEWGWLAVQGRRPGGSRGFRPFLAGRSALARLLADPPDFTDVPGDASVFQIVAAELPSTQAAWHRNVTCRNAGPTTLTAACWDVRRLDVGFPEWRLAGLATETAEVS